MSDVTTVPNMYAAAPNFSATGSQALNGWPRVQEQEHEDADEQQRHDRGGHQDDDAEDAIAAIETATTSQSRALGDCHAMLPTKPTDPGVRACRSR
jgi:hypothetical protein